MCSEFLQLNYFRVIIFKVHIIIDVTHLQGLFYIHWSIYLLLSLIWGVILTPFNNDTFILFQKKPHNSISSEKYIWITERLYKSSGLKPATLASYPKFTSYDLYTGVCWGMFNNQLWSKNRPWFMGFVNFHVVFSNLLWLVLSHRSEIGKLQLGSNMYDWLFPVSVNLV